MGQADNVAHFRDILSALFLQTGNTIVSYDTSMNSNQVTLANGAATVPGQPASAGLPAVQALNFYTSFTNPANTNYTWNNALPDSLQNFLAGNSAFYLGRASELFTIQAQNPNLNFDVMPLFQSTSAVRPVTYGSFIAAGVMKSAPNFNAGYAAVFAMANSANADILSKQLSLPPVRRDLLQVAQNNPYVSVFFQAALSSFSWLDPNPANTNKIFHDMITNVNSNTIDSDTAVAKAAQSLQSSLQH
jgi:hypothetical protein